MLPKLDVSKLSATPSTEHPGRITAIRKIDDCRIIVCGMLNSLHMYDLRFAGALPEHAKAKVKVTGSIAATTPYLSFPEYNNSYYSDIGFDVDTEIGLVAAATDNFRVKLFSLKSGMIIDTPTSNRTLDDPVPCVRFARTRSMLSSDYVDIENEPKSLLVANGKVIEEWHCSAVDDCAKR